MGLVYYIKAGICYRIFMQKVLSELLQNVSIAIRKQLGFSMIGCQPILAFLCATTWIYIWGTID